jgi:autotransporter translocation and assembly factor TamB
VTGDIDVIDGGVTFQGEAFEVRDGVLSFYGNPDNPEISLVADADIFNTCRDTDVTADVSQTMSLSGVVDTGEQKTYHVILNVRGRLDNLDIQFESNPYADQRDILSLLLTGCTVDQLTASSASSPTLEVALGPVLGWIEGQVQDVVEVEEFTITPSVDRLKATVGDSISRRMSWRLQLDTGLTEVATGQRFQLEYRLSDRWSARASESSTESSQFDSFLVDFKLRYRIFLD